MIAGLRKITPKSLGFAPRFYGKMDSTSTPFTHRDQLLPQLSELHNLEEVCSLEPWLLNTPNVSTIRVNLLRTTVTAVQDLVCRAFTDKYGTAGLLQFILHPEIPELLGFYSLPSKDMEWETDKEVVVDCSCGSSILRGANLYAPGVLAMSKHTKEGELVQVFVDLAGKCRRGSFEFISSLKHLVGLGKVIQPRYKLFGDHIVPRGIAVEMIATVSNVPSLGDSYLSMHQGILQNLPSMIAVRTLNPQPGETILDMCAAPGHKTLHIVEMMRGEGRVVALDRVAKKILVMQQNIKELKYNSCIKCFATDSTKCVDETATEYLFEPPFPPATFDRILLDAPCSGLGNRPQLPYSNKMTPKMLRSYPIMQKQLFFPAVLALKSGGVLVFSTCTINQNENESIVGWALKKFPQLKLVPIESCFGRPGWKTTGLDKEQTHMVKRFGPPSVDDALQDTTGFFVAKFIKD